MDRSSFKQRTRCRSRSSRYHAPRTGAPPAHEPLPLSPTQEKFCRNCEPSQSFPYFPLGVGTWVNSCTEPISRSIGASYVVCIALPSPLVLVGRPYERSAKVSREPSTTKATLQPSSDPLQGAYGFRIAGLGGAREILGDAPAGWLELHVERRREPVAARLRIDDDGMVIPIGVDGAIALDWRARHATVSMPHPPPDHALAHPYLAPIAAAFAWRSGREAVHAGGFVAGNRVWGVVAEKGGGKSSLLAWLASSGYTVFADDMIVLDRGRCFAGPRCIDLRFGTLGHLMGMRAMDVDARIDRQRVRLAPVDPELPFGGWVLLRWGAAVEVGHVPAGARIGRLSPHRSIRLQPVNPAALVEAVAHPMLELARPRDWRVMPRAVDVLVETVTQL